VHQLVIKEGSETFVLLFLREEANPQKDTLLHKVFDFFWPNFSTAFNESDYIIFQMSFRRKMNTPSVSAVCYVM